MLYEVLSGEYHKLEEMLSETGGEITQEIQRYMDKLEFQEDEQIDNAAEYIQYLDSCAKACRERAKSYEARARTMESRKEWQEQCMMRYMAQRNMTKRKTAFHDVSLRQAGGKQAMDIDMEFLPPELKRTKQVEFADNEEIRRLLESGKEIPGVTLLARKQVLHIK